MVDVIIETNKIMSVICKYLLNPTKNNGALCCALCCALATVAYIGCTRHNPDDLYSENADELYFSMNNAIHGRCLGDYVAFHAASNVFSCTARLSGQPYFADVLPVGPLAFPPLFTTDRYTHVQGAGLYVNESLTGTLSRAEYVNITKTFAVVLNNISGADKKWYAFVAPTQDIHYLCSAKEFMVFQKKYRLDAENYSLSMAAVKNGHVYVRTYGFSVPKNKDVDNLVGAITNILDSHGSQWMYEFTSLLYEFGRNKSILGDYMSRGWARGRSTKDFLPGRPSEAEQLPVSEDDNMNDPTNGPGYTPGCMRW